MNDCRLLRQFVHEVVASASPEYMKKERIREYLQDHLLELVKNDQIQSDDDLATYFETLKMALEALRAVPLTVWQQIVHE